MRFILSILFSLLVFTVAIVSQGCIMGPTAPAGNENLFMQECRTNLTHTFACLDDNPPLESNVELNCNRLRSDAENQGPECREAYLGLLSCQNAVLADYPECSDYSTADAQFSIDCADDYARVADACPGFRSGIESRL